MLTVEDIDTAQTLLANLASLVEKQQQTTGEIVDLLREYADVLLAQIKGERDA